MTKEEAFEIGLSKWPQMVVNGKSISEEQALEIIRRTDIGFSHMMYSPRYFLQEYKDILKVPNEEDYSDWKKWYDAIELWEEKWKAIELDYIENHWVFSNYCYGVYGWCHPDGTIGSSQNIGKYPSVEEVYEDWVKVSKEFPFLDLTVTLNNGEEDFCDKSLVTMYVHDGIVEFIDTIPFEKLTFHKIKIPRDLTNVKHMYFSLEQIQKWSDAVFGK